MTPPVPGYSAWWDAAQITGVADGAGLFTWPDASGNGNDLIQSISAHQPIYYNTTTSHLINGQPVVVFNALQLMDSPNTVSLSPALPWSVVGVAQCTATTGFNAVYCTANNITLYVQAGTPGNWLMGAVPTVTPTATPGQDVHFFANVYGTSPGNNCSFQQDATLQTGLTCGRALATAPWHVGSDGSNSLHGPICELILYPFALTATDLANLHHYLETKWLPPASASLPLGPLVVASTSSISASTVTGTATLNIGPILIVAADTVATVTASAAHIGVGPVLVAALGGRVGPGAWPIPGYRGRWRLTLHTRAFAAATLGSTMIAELADARGRQLVQQWNQPATLTFMLDGRSQAAGLVTELEHDVVAWRWDDQTGQEFAVFRGVIAQSEDQITTENHTVTYIAHDYAAVLSRRLIVNTYTVTARDQDLIAGDLVSHASSATTSAGTSLLPASFLPISLLTVHPDGSLRGLSGQTRDRTYYGSQNIGTAFTQLAAIIDGFDWDVAPSAVDDHDSLRVFYPNQGVTRTDVTLQYGSTVAALTRTVNSADYANYIRVLGNNSSSSPTPQLFAEAETVDAGTTTAGTWMLGDDAADVTQVQTLLEKAQGDLNLDAVLVPNYTLTLTPDAYTWGNPNMGDTIGLVVQSGRLNVNTDIRVLGITYDIGDDGQEDVALVVGRPATSLSKMFLYTDRDIKALARR